MVKSSLRKSILAWCLYDAGSAAFPTVIITFVYSVYFARQVAGDATQGSALWSYALAASGLLVALAGPLLGALADHYGARKPGVVLFSLLCVIPAAFLYFIAPGGPVMTALVLMVAANAAYEIALIFANALLPHIAPPALIGRVSGWAWGSGYMGGLACLALALTGLVGVGGHAPLLPLPQGHMENIRATAPLAALWFAVLAVPFVLWTHDPPRTGLSLKQAAAAGAAQLAATAKTARHHGNLLRFLIASALYRDGLNTLFAVGGLYAAGTFGMDFTEIMIFAIGLNVTAGAGAALFAVLDDRLGSKRTIMAGLAGLLLTGTAVLCVHDKHAFIALALVLGAFIGPAQAASRTLAARLSPPDKVAQTYGLYALTGRATAFLGPLCFGLATALFDSQRAGMATIILFWLAGLVLLAFVKEKRA